MPEISAVPYDPGWPTQFRVLGARIRAALGPLALRIDHIGSTAIPGLAAKPIVDIQISVNSFDDLAQIERALAGLGLRYHADNPDKTQRYFREAPGQPRTHIHVRRSGSFQEVFTLLFRDYLRSHPADAKAYEENKYDLMQPQRGGGPGYTGQGAAVWGIIARANAWSEDTGWHPGQSDA